jgi:hypothetical protein
MRIALLFLVLPCIAVRTIAQQLPPYSKYPVSSTYKGKPAPAQPTSKFAQRYRTVIREGAKKGPNFAGHYTVVFWGCGTACAQFAIVDAENGKVFDPPFKGVSFENPQGGFFKQSGIHYELNSSLLVLQGCPEDKDCAEHLYEWNGEKLEAVGTNPLVPIIPRE